MVARTFPLWGTVLLLVVTRIPQIGLKEQLIRREPNMFTLYLGTYGTFKMSASFVLELQNILTYPQINWKYELLYIPFVMPFAIISVLTMVLYRKDLQASPNEITRTVLGRLKNPAIALMGALVLVQLLINEGPASPATIIGTIMADAFQGGWIAVAALIGALGSFFSGSTTISNLTFGEIHKIAAESIGVSTTSLLALQAAGASAGNGICLNNIISACAVVGLNVGEGKIIAKTGLPVLLFCIIATLVMLAYLF
jgi:lactate permease